MKKIQKSIHSSLLFSLLVLSLPSWAAGEVTQASDAQTQEVKNTETPKATAAPVHLDKQPLDKIVAIVNNSVITENELNLQVNLVKETLNRRNMPMPPESILRKQVLQHMIDTDLELQMAKNAGIEIDRKYIRIPGNTIKRTGKFEALIRLHRNVEYNYEFNVVSDAPAEPKAKETPKTEAAAPSENA